MNNKDQAIYVKFYLISINIVNKKIYYLYCMENFKYTELCL